MPDNTIPLPEGDYLYTNPSQLPNAGMGLYTAIPIYKDEVVALYKGKILTMPRARLLAKQGLDKFFIQLPNNTIMDSMEIACFAKYANDATAYPGATLKNNTKIALDDNSIPCLIATRNIKTGSEIFCSYGKKYWAKHREQ
jgi:uncharacterized protein